MRVAAFCLAVLALAPSASAADPPDRGRLEEFIYEPNAAERETFVVPNPYLVYTPSTYRATKPAPLLVVVHGCNTSAMQQARANRHHPIAERAGFVVLYPDNPHVGDRGQCWSSAPANDPRHLRRGWGDPAIVANMTRDVMTRWNIDPQRVYVIGMSSGAYMTTILAMTYPDLFAAIGVMAGGPFAPPGCVNPAQSADAQRDCAAREGMNAMGPRKRIVPGIILHGDADPLVSYANADRNVQQRIAVSNLIVSGSTTGPLSFEPSATRKGRIKNGYAYTVDVYNDPQGCRFAEKWTVHGMGHYWSGGSKDPAWYEWEDPKGPSAAQASWDFFERFRKDETALPCAESRH